MGTWKGWELGIGYCEMILFMALYFLVEFVA